MTVSPAPTAPPPKPPDAAKRRKKIIVSVIVASVVLHLAGGIVAGIWIVARYFEKPKAQFAVEKRIAIDPEPREHRMQTEQVESLRPKPVFNNRITSLRPTALALPELPKIPVDATVPIDTESLLNDQIDSLASGRSGKGSGAGGFFGGSGKAGSGLLEGTLYDLKQTADGKPTDITPEEYVELVQRFSRSWNDGVFSKFYRAPGKLYATRILLPIMAAENAPKEFGVADKVQPSRWVIHYKGRVKAPSDGRYRFAGIGDDVLLVRFNRLFVLDGSFTEARTDEGSRRYVYPLWCDPRLHEIYTAMQGHSVGKQFEVKAGSSYDIEILVGEGPGSDFYGFLQIEKIGGDHAKDTAGNPVLPFFQMADQPVPGDLSGRIPPHAKTSEIWAPAPAGVSGFAP